MRTRVSMRFVGSWMLGALVVVGAGCASRGGDPVQLDPDAAAPSESPEGVQGAAPDEDADRANGRTVRLGAILSLTGVDSTLGAPILEGIDLALEEYAQANPGRASVELFLEDDRSDPALIPDLVRALEDVGVVAVLGPLTSGSFRDAVEARTDEQTPIISPTANEVHQPAPAAWTLDDGETRELDVATELGRWAGRLGLSRVGVLEPLGGRLALPVQAFERAVEQGGGIIVGKRTYDPNLTTYQEAIESLSALDPDVVFAPAATTPGALAVASQVFFYGLYDAIILGNEIWLDPEVTRRLENFATDHRVVGIGFDRTQASERWQAFNEKYEITYLKSLRDNRLPALSYDATRLVLEGLVRGSEPTRRGITDFLSEGPEISGATGLLTPGTGSVVHRLVHVRMLVEGQVLVADPVELRRWLREVRAGPSPFAPRDTLP